MIERVQFRNYKALRDIALDLGRLTVLVGPNASGKTSVLEGIYQLTQTAAMKLTSVFGQADQCRVLRSRGADGQIEITATGTHDGSPGHMKLALDVEPQGGGAPAGTIDYAWSGTARVVTQELVDTVELVKLPQLPPFLSGASLVRFERKMLAEPAYTERAPRVATDGTGLAAALTELAVTWPERFQAIQAALREIIPAVLRVRLVRAPVQRVEWESITIDNERISRPVTRQYAGYEIIFDMRGASDVPARLASEGTLLVLGLLTVLHGPNEGRLALLDDIDRALHPRAQSDLVKQLRVLLQVHPDLQIIATSHSPYLLDDLDYEEIRLTTLQDDGSALCAPLTEHPDYPRWKDHMLPGEFWSMVAEDWIKRRKDGGDV